MKSFQQLVMRVKFYYSQGSHKGVEFVSNKAVSLILS